MKTKSKKIISIEKMKEFAGLAATFTIVMAIWGMRFGMYL